MSQQSNSISFIGRSRGISDEVYFLICQSCFWCTSYMTNILKTNRSPPNCPVCIKGNIESMPIAKNEGYKFDYDIKRESY
jgi:hypothetical protein